MRKHEVQRKTVIPERIRKARGKKVGAFLFKLFIFAVVCAGLLGLYARDLYTGIRPYATIETVSVIN